MEDWMARSKKPCQTRTRRLVLVMGMFASVVLVFRSFSFNTRSVVSPSFPLLEMPVLQKRSPSSKDISSPNSMRVGEFSLLSDSTNSTQTSVVVEVVEKNKTSEVKEDNRVDEDGTNMGSDSDDDFEVDGDGDPDKEFLIDLGDGFVLEKIEGPDGYITLEKSKITKNGSFGEQDSVGKSNTSLVLEDVGGLNDGFPEEKNVELNNSTNPNKTNGSLPSSPPSVSIVPHEDGLIREKVDANANGTSIPVVSDILSKVDDMGALSNGSVMTNSVSADAGSVSMKKKKKQANPPATMSEMNDILIKNRASSRAMRPRWSSAHDQKLLGIKALIENAPIVRADRELHMPAFRNISMFKRSYNLMERTLKVYVYKEGSKPVFHQGPIKGIYASEGWFMRLMEGNRQYTVKDPRKAHLFYMPFSSRNLEFSLYVPNSHNRHNLVDYLESYVDKIVSKYPYWNRTGGADHFLVACHDWAPYETRHALRRTIRALCNADITDGFKIGKDVSLPETYVRSARNPLRDLGGRPARERPILAFFAGNMHGRTRPILIQHWENRDPDMKILGPMPPGVKSKMNYIQYMKTSKYCLCPRGYEVNSPRVVEAIFYECVPVLMSDNYVPPFFEVLDWDVFSVTVEEKDIPRLKEILSAIPEERYLELQNGVRRVQQHFVWHSKPVKYDLFHMVLHSVWFNRLNQIKIR
ncbi:putative glycosyltransferase [Acorus calamus]|uniref:Glycosyltransferase n=1 Tax=Acorus calamus TaxID=4465 RepID=A0AAV9ENY7_ACOCL|nr:putative glycosyltransferase [Acorus calamus]